VGSVAIRVLAEYAMWTYLPTPFLFAMDGVATEELQPWRENGEMWRRLKVTFPHNRTDAGTPNSRTQHLASGAVVRVLGVSR
jgi:hypothetical protein